jgi:Mg-chelatase subunit ChlD
MPWTTLTFADPYLLLTAALLLVPFLVKRRTFVGYSHLGLLEKALASHLWSKVPVILFLLAVTSFLIALARPQKREYMELMQTEAQDIILVIDLSYSMETGMAGEGVKRKVDLAREAARAFVKKQEGNRVALLIFGDETYGSWPLTTDLKMIDEKLQNIGNRFYGGTNLEKPFRKAFQHFEELGQSKTKVLIFVSDGDAPIPSETKAEISRHIIRTDIHFYLMGIQLMSAGDILEVVKASKGKFIDIQRKEEFNKGFEEIDRLESSIITIEKTEVHPHEFYQVFALVGLILFLLMEVIKNSLVVEVP